MNKTSKTFAAAIISLCFVFSAFTLHAKNHFAFGPLLGYNPDVTHLGSQYGNRYQTQENFLFGVTLKIDIGFFFIQSSGFRSLLSRKGLAKNKESALRKTNVQYWALPAHVGLNIPLMGRGTFFLGVGGAYHWISGKLETTEEDVNLGVGVFGHGFVTGVQLWITDTVIGIFEWEYFSGRSRPQIDGNASLDYKDISVDLTGNKIYFGLLYYFL